MIKVITQSSASLDSLAVKAYNKFIVGCFLEAINLSEQLNHIIPTVYIVAYNNNVLVGCITIIDRKINHKNKSYKVVGIGNVYVKDSMRNKGIGKKMMLTANKYILNGKYNLGLLFSHPKLDNFYTSVNWIKKEEGKIFFSQKGKQTYERTSYLYPVVISSEDLLFWLHDDIHIGEGSW